jgi:hypothetical protein
MKLISAVFSVIFSLAIVIGVVDLLFSMKAAVYIDPEALKDLQYQQDIAF